MLLLLFSVWMSKKTLALIALLDNALDRWIVLAFGSESDHRSFSSTFSKSFSVLQSGRRPAVWPTLCAFFF